MVESTASETSFCVSIATGDLNDFVKPGFFPVASVAVKNLPEKSFGALQVIVPTAGRFIQRFTTFTSPTRDFTRTRFRDRDWSPWVLAGGGSIRR